MVNIIIIFAIIVILFHLNNLSDLHIQVWFHCTEHDGVLCFNLTKDYWAKTQSELFIFLYLGSFSHFLAYPTCTRNKAILCP